MMLQTASVAPACKNGGVCWACNDLHVCTTVHFGVRILRLPLRPAMEMFCMPLLLLLVCHELMLAGLLAALQRGEMCTCCIGTYGS